MDRMNKCITDLDQRVDKQHFLETNTAAFSLPKKFDFQSHKGDEVCLPEFSFNSYAAGG